MAGPFVEKGSYYYSVNLRCCMEARFDRSLTLPGRVCVACGEREFHISLARFDLPVPPTIETTELEGPKTLSKEQFADLIGRITADPVVRNELLPGTELGSPLIRLPRMPCPMMGAGFMTIANENVTAQLKRDGIEITAVQVKTSKGPEAEEAYFHFVPVIKSVLDENWLQLERTLCPACSGWKLNPGIPFPRETGFDRAKVVRSRWPGRAGMVYSPEIGTVLFSPELVGSCHKWGVLGVPFHEVSWVI